MPVGWPFLWYSEPEPPRPPGVNKGHKRGVTKSPRPRRKK